MSAHGDGRIKVWTPDGRQFRYRVVWNETHPEDPVLLGDHVHHINGDKADDRPENLVKISPSAHAILHNTSGKKREAHQRAAARRKRRLDGTFA